jgi:hypothetical protein
VGGKSKKQTIGYKYYLGRHDVLCHGPIDEVQRISVDQRLAWSGASTGGSITINAPSLFGGESREGGVSGTVDIAMGEPTQGQNSYLVGQLGSTVPGYRGVVSAILRQCYMGNNPYLKAWSYRGKRVHVRQDGIEQWYDATAAISGDADRTPVIGDRPWTDRNTGYFVIGAGPEIGGTLTGFQGWWHGNIDSFRITKGVARYTSVNYTIPSSVFPSDGTDPYWDNVVLLLLMEGADGSTTVTDEKGHTVTAFGSAQLSTARAKFGSSSLLLDGVGDYLTATMGATDEDLGNAWTMEAWVWLELPISGGVFEGSIFGYGPLSTGGADTYWQCIDGTTWRFGQQIPSGAPPFYGVSQNTTPYMQAGRWAFVSVCWDGTNFWLHQDGRLLTITSEGSDMNPAHIIRECLTDPDWGMGYQDADIDDTSFQAAADQLVAEGLGMSLLWDRQIQLEDFIKEVTKHIDAALYVDRVTGKFVLKLIRADYDEGSLIVLDESNISKVANPARATFGELVNSVTANYWDVLTGKDASLTVTDTAMVQQQGVVINTTLQYPGFTNSRNATLAAQRDLRALSSPYLSCTIYADSTAEDLNIGDTFKFSWSRWSIQEMVMRVTGIAFGDGKTKQVRITCTQDVFSTPLVSVVQPGPGSEWVDPAGPPSPVTEQIAVEAPYFEGVQVLGQSTIDGALVTNTEAGYVIAAAPRAASAINARMWTDSGAGYTDAAALDFCPYAELASGINKTTDVLNITAGVDLEEVELGQHCQIGDELMRVDGIDLVGNTLTVGRGVLDTVPEAHLAGVGIYFWDLSSAYDTTEYTAGETIGVKVVPTSGSGVVDVADAVEMLVELDQRAFRPYPPGNLLINTESYSTVSDYEGELTIAWAHRDRLQQTSGTLADHFDGDIGPEAGTTYRLQGYINGVLEHTEDDIAGTSTTWTPSGAGMVKIEVHSKRDGVYSLQAPWHEFDYAAAGRLTEASVKRVTEDDENRETEE